MVDIWYEDQRSKVNGMDCYFSDCDCVYRGNLYADRKPVGDYEAKDSKMEHDEEEDDEDEYM